MKTFLFTLVLSLYILNSYAQTKNENPKKLFREFWEWVDKNYIFFNSKSIDWNMIYTKYENKINDNTPEDQLFAIMDSAVLELKDGHSLLIKPNKIGSQYNFRSGYEIHFNPNMVKKNYVTDSLGSSGNLYWAILENNIGYVYLPQFNKYGEFFNVFKLMKEKNVSRLIIDVRGNGGGNSNLVPELLGVLVKNKTLLGYYTEKTGPGHSDIIKPIGIYATPNANLCFDIPVSVLINRSCYSATTYFAAMIKGLPNVTLIGQTTGGGAGGHLGYQLSNGFQIRVSVSDFLDKNGLTTENGVEPDIFIENTRDDLLSGRDKMLETAMRLIY